MLDIDKLQGQKYFPDEFDALRNEISRIKTLMGSEDYIAVVNYAEGLVDRPYQPGVLFEGLATPEEAARVRAVEEAFPDLVLRLLPAMAGTARQCPCPRLMERYRLRGDISDDWRTWVR